MMAAQPRSSLRFSVRREDLNRSHPHHHPSSTSDTRSTRTTSNKSSRQQTLDFKTIASSNSSSNQTKQSGNNPITQTRQLPERRAKPQLHQSPLTQQSLTASLPPTTATTTSTNNNAAQEPPLKKAKLDGSHEPNASPVAKLPLRSRDAPDSRNGNGNGNGTIKTSAATTRTRTRAASGSLSTPHVETAATTRSSRHSNTTAASDLPVALDKDAESTAAAGRNSKEGVTPDENDRRATNKGAKNAEDPAGRRSLRSHDGGSRSKSELAMYFQNYEQMLSLEPKKPEFLTADTTILLIDDLSEPIITPSSPSSASTRKKRDRHTTKEDPSHQGDANNPLSNLHNAQKIDLPEVKIARRDQTKDPLSDDVYFKAHRRIERQEKQLRNIEKERAQYEKVQLERLLEGLQGHDWLRVMGISGITDSEKKLYEPKREFFIKEVTALLDKFRVWKVEEKRRKMEKDRLLAQEAEEEDEEEAAEEEEEEAEEASAESVEEDDADEDEAEVDDQEVDKSGIHTPDANDVDAWAAHQLHQEATLTSDRKRQKQDSNAEQADTEPPPPLLPQQPFRSFYSKPYLRDAAIGKHRRGRKRTAFGHPVPEMEEREFQLPDDILTPEAVRACQRKRRRLTRGVRE